MARAEDLVDLDRLGHRLAGGERGDRVVRGEALDAEVVELLAHFLRVGDRPGEVWGVELDDLIADAGDGLERVGEIAGELAAHGVELDPDGVGSLERLRRAWRSVFRAGRLGEGLRP